MVNVNKNSAINYIELPMVKNAENKKYSIIRRLNGSLQIGGPTTSNIFGVL